MFGQDYAAIMTKALDVALAGERKPGEGRLVPADPAGLIQINTPTAAFLLFA